MAGPHERRRIGTSLADSLLVCRLGRIEYERAFDLQTKLVDGLVSDDAAPYGYLLLLEHPPTFTIGRSGSADNVRASAEQLAARGAKLLTVNRGGDVTFHGPGQVVAYPIVRLERQGRDVHRYLRQLEETIIRTLGKYRVDGHRKPGLTGVWVGEEKVAAIGVAIRRWITYHGISINVDVDLSYFDLIHPCGIRGRGVTSLARILGRQVDPAAVADAFAAGFGDVFGAELLRIDPHDLEHQAVK